MEKAEIQSLIRDAFEAQKFAYVPYSRFHVGAALLGKRHGLQRLQYRECQLHPHQLCRAHRPFKAVSEGEREFTAIAIVGSKVGRRTPLSPAPAGSAARHCLSSAARA